MTLAVGWHYLPAGEDDPLPPLPAAVFLDLAPSKGLASPERLCRPYVTGRPDPASFADKASGWHQKGCRVQALNEPNLPQEGFGGSPANYQNWFFSVKAKCPGVRLYWAGMSPGVPGWEAWYAGAGIADGIAAHAYGTREQMQSIVDTLLHLGKPLWLAEVNFGAGQTVDRDRWAEDELRPFLDWCAGQPLVEAVTYFAYRWPTPDTSTPTPVDGAGTRIETVLRTWTPPEEGAVPDVVLTVPEDHVHAAAGNWGAGESFGACVGVLVHSTAGPSDHSIDQEYRSTIAWFQSPASGVSAQRVVGADRVNTSVHDAEKAYAGREPDNTRRRHIELAHPGHAAWNVRPYPDAQYEMAGELIARWRLVDEARGWRWPIRLLSRDELAANPLAAGIALHKDTPAGVSDGKRDPTGPFDPPRLIAAAERWYAQLTGGAPMPPTPDDVAALHDRVYALAQAIQDTAPAFEAAGCPHAAAFCREQGEATKEFVNAHKGQR